MQQSFNGNYSVSEALYNVNPSSPIAASVSPYWPNQIDDYVNYNYQHDGPSTSNAPPGYFDPPTPAAPREYIPKSLFEKLREEFVELKANFAKYKNENDKKFELLYALIGKQHVSSESVCCNFFTFANK